jgi:hypothetical protein
MASFESIGVVFQIIQNIYGLVNNMRDNASGYKAQLLPPFNRTPAQVAPIMVADAQQYLLRMAMITTLATNNLTLFTAALAIFGLVPADANTLKATLTTVANHTIAATLNNATQINTEADFILANVPNFGRIF